MRSVKPPRATTQLPSTSADTPSGRRRKLGRPKKKPILDTKTVLDLLDRGFTAATIARKLGVSREAANKAVSRVQRERLAGLLQQQADTIAVAIPEIVPATSNSPIDIMGEVMSVIEDVRIFRAWVGSDEAKKIPLHRRIEYLQKVWEVKLHWASGFIQVYSKLLDLIAFDTWLRDILDIAEEVSPGSREKIRARLRDRLHGRHVAAPAAPTTPT
jgi:hypothetical protein